jgi:hypothetical protein
LWPGPRPKTPAAYLHFWDVRAKALMDLDPSPLGEVLDGPALQREVAGLDSLRAQNQAEQMDIQHHILVMHATDDDATIFDQYVSQIVPVDLTTNEPLPAEPTGTWWLAYHFRKLAGTWKVVKAVRINA